jgi:DNA replication protein DnaC
MDRTKEFTLRDKFHALPYFDQVIPKWTQKDNSWLPESYEFDDDGLTYIYPLFKDAGSLARYETKDRSEPWAKAVLEVCGPDIKPSHEGMFESGIIYLPPEHPDYDKEVERVENFKRLEKEKEDAELKKFRDKSRLSRRYQEALTFGTFLPTDDNRAAFDIALKFFNNDVWALTLIGEPGRGKTHLAVAIANRAMSRRQTTIYYQTEDLLDALRAGFNGAEPSYESLMEDLQNVSVLILDDLGSEKKTPWAAGKLDQLIDFRYREGKKTVITTNCPPEQIGARIASRLKEGYHVIVKGPDYRLLRGLQLQRKTEASQ